MKKLFTLFAATAVSVAVFGQAASVTEIVSPAPNACALSATEEITVNVKNNSANTLTTVDIAYSIGDRFGNVLVAETTQTAAVNIAPNDSADVTLVATADLSNEAAYVVRADIDAIGEEAIVSVVGSVNSIDVANFEEYGSNLDFFQNEEAALFSWVSTDPNESFPTGITQQSQGWFVGGTGVETYTNCMNIASAGFYQLDLTVASFADDDLSDLQVSIADAVNGTSEVIITLEDLASLTLIDTVIEFTTTLDGNAHLVFETTEGAADGIAIEDLFLERLPQTDILVVDLGVPAANGCLLSNAEELTTAIVNNGVNDVSNITVEYSVTLNGTEVATGSETVALLEVDSFEVVTFTANADMSAEGLYEVTYSATAAGDEVVDNNEDSHELRGVSTYDVDVEGEYFNNFDLNGNDYQAWPLAGEADFDFIDQAETDRALLLINFQGPSAAVSRCFDLSADGGYAVSFDALDFVGGIDINVFVGNTSDINDLITNGDQIGSLNSADGNGELFFGVETDDTYYIGLVVNQFNGDGIPLVNNFSVRNVCAEYTATGVSTPTAEGSSNGTATATGVGGSGTATYLWGNGETTATITGLAVGTYMVTVTDDVTGCTATASVDVDEFDCNTSDLAIASFDVENETDNNANGSVEVNVTGGSMPYIYLWNTNASTKSITGLSAGDYTVEVTDGIGCTVTGVATVDMISNIADAIGVETTIYPNPASNVLTVEAAIENAQLEIISINGAVVYSADFTSKQVIDVSALNAGTYLVKVAVDGKTGFENITIAK